ncbi:MAG: VOC family protein, partial [Henriciella sp.]
MSIEFLHTMVRVEDIGASIKFYVEGLGLTEVARYD